jgi:hypothetical protein
MHWMSSEAGFVQHVVMRILMILALRLKRPQRALMVRECCASLSVPCVMHLAVQVGGLRSMLYLPECYHRLEPHMCDVCCRTVTSVVTPLAVSRRARGVVYILVIVFN